MIRNNYGIIPFQEICKLIPTKTKNAVAARQSFLRICVHKIYSKDEQFFSIPNTINSSIAGIIASDGHINQNDRLAIVLNSKDHSLVEEINTLLKSNYKISKSEKPAVFNDKRTGKTYNYIDRKSSLYITKAEKWADDLLKNWNIPRGKKSLVLEPPVNLRDMDTKLAYLSGLITGDGSIFYTSTPSGGDKRDESMRISMLGTEKLLEWAKQSFEEFVGYKFASEVRGGGEKSNIFTLNINGITAAKIIEKVNSLKVVKLSRKWENPEVLRVIESFKSRHQNSFSSYWLRNIKEVLINILKKSNIEFNDIGTIIEIPSKNLAIGLVELRGQEIFTLNLFNSYRDKGVRLIQIFEEECSEKIISTRVKSYLGLTKYKINARECLVKEVSTEIKNKFLNKYHVQGENYGASVNLGLFYKNRLVSVMSFAKRGDDYDLARFSCNGLFSIRGGASKLLSYFEKNNPGKTIFSFADKRWSDGGVYKTLKFNAVHEVKPTYLYFKNTDKTLYHKFGFRHKYLTQKLQNYNPNLTEWENMKNHGWSRIWNCGLIKFEKVCP